MEQESLRLCYSEVKMKLEKVQYIEVDYDELTKFIVEHLPAPTDYNMVAEEEWSNDSDHVVSVDPPTDYDLKFDLKELREQLTAGRPKLQYNLGTIMQELATRGLLEYGNYLVTVCW